MYIHYTTLHLVDSLPRGGVDEDQGGGEWDSQKQNGPHHHLAAFPTLKWCLHNIQLRGSALAGW